MFFVILFVLLLLLDLGEGLALSGLLLPDADEPGLSAGHAEGGICGGTTEHLLGDPAAIDALLGIGLPERDERLLVLLGVLDIADALPLDLLCRLGLGQLLRLLVDVPAALLAREDHQPRLVLLQPLDVLQEDGLRLVGPPVIDRDSEAECLLLLDSGFLQLNGGEASSESQLRVVFDGGASHHWAQQALRWPREQLGRLLLTRDPPLVLLGRLVEPRLHEALPVLVEMDIGKDVVVSDHVVVVVFEKRKTMAVFLINKNCLFI